MESVELRPQPFTLDRRKRASANNTREERKAALGGSDLKREIRARAQFVDRHKARSLEDLPELPIHHTTTLKKTQTTSNLMKNHSSLVPTSLKANVNATITLYPSESPISSDSDSLDHSGSLPTSSKQTTKRGSGTLDSNDLEYYLKLWLKSQVSEITQAHKPKPKSSNLKYTKEEGVHYARHGVSLVNSSSQTSVDSFSQTISPAEESYIERIRKKSSLKQRDREKLMETLKHLIANEPSQDLSGRQASLTELQELESKVEHKQRDLMTRGILQQTESESPTNDSSYNTGNPATPPIFIQHQHSTSQAVATPPRAFTARQRLRLLSELKSSSNQSSADDLEKELEKAKLSNFYDDANSNQIEDDNMRCPAPDPIDMLVGGFAPDLYEKRERGYQNSPPTFKPVNMQAVKRATQDFANPSSRRDKLSSSSTDVTFQPDQSKTYKIQNSPRSAFSKTSEKEVYCKSS